MLFRGPHELRSGQQSEASGAARLCSVGRSPLVMLSHHSTHEDVVQPLHSDVGVYGTGCCPPKRGSTEVLCTL